MILNLKGVKVHLHDSAKQLTANRYKEYQNYLSQETEIGSDTNGVKSRFEDVLKFVDSDVEAVRNVAINGFFAVQTIESKINYGQRSFALLISRIDYNSGQQYKPESYSDDELDFMIDELSKYGLTQELVESSNKDIKKK